MVVTDRVANAFAVSSIILKAAFGQFSFTLVTVHSIGFESLPFFVKLFSTSIVTWSTQLLEVEMVLPPAHAKVQVYWVSPVVSLVILTLAYALVAMPSVSGADIS